MLAVMPERGGCFFKLNKKQEVIECAFLLNKMVVTRHSRVETSIMKAMANCDSYFFLEC